jgi:hypothetical protein
MSNETSRYECMIDIETTSTKNNACILSISALKFKRDPEDKSYYVFDKKVSLQSCKDVGLESDAKTMIWWGQQKESSIVEVFGINKNGEGDDRLPLKLVLSDFNIWFNQEPKPDLVWCQGLNFDIPILSEAYSRCGINTPWKYYNVRDTRTLYDIADFKDTVKNTDHISLKDCYRQVQNVKTCKSRLPFWKGDKL